MMHHDLSVCSCYTHKYMLYYGFIKSHMLFAIYFMFKIVGAPVSGYEVLIEEIMYNCYSALNRHSLMALV